MSLLPWKSPARLVRPAQPTRPQTSAFEDLAMPLVPALHNVAVWLSRNPTDAEDLVQETILKALRGFASFELGTNFKAWIFRILSNTYLTSRSGLAARRTVPLDDELDESGESGPALYPEAAIDRQTPELNLLRLSDPAQLQAAMENLPAPLLEVILLCDVEEMKYKEIAAVLEIPIGTVMSRIARARLALRTSLEGPAKPQKESRA
jgi:RNA polymerase sigma-70 factor (ECF subfamily)